MKVFLATLIKRKSEKEIHSKIFDVLKKYKFEVFECLYELESESRKNISEIQKQSIQIINELKESDIFIGNMTRPSQTLGFLLATAINNGLPSLYLYDENSKAKPFAPLFGHPSRLLSYKSYKKSTDIDNEVNEFIEKAFKQIKSDRLTFVSTKEINSYIDKVSVEKGISKGEVIRGIIEKNIEDESS